jgi:hypothetical protein
MKYFIYLILFVLVGCIIQSSTEPAINREIELSPLSLPNITEISNIDVGSRYVVGIDVSETGEIYSISKNGEIVKWNSNGTISSIQFYQTGSWGVADIEVSDNYYYVMQWHDNVVEKLDKNTLDVLTSWNFTNKPNAVAARNDTIHVIGYTGKMNMAFDSGAKRVSMETIGYTGHVDVSSDDIAIYAVARDNLVKLLLNSSYSSGYIKQWSVGLDWTQYVSGDTTFYMQEEGTFFPNGVTVDESGRIYVITNGILYRNDDQYIKIWDTNGLFIGSMSIDFIPIDIEYYGNNIILIYGEGHIKFFEVT